ncbi:MAG: selenoneine biosynthesis selenosugar synthase SenB [Marinobacter sp.]|uniref:selenoneine biosynthesis selenosugar synthase SenB n=1 Tax=Marinobacter sp. TaxID=50741 RepID=UPI0034A02117
MLDILIVTPAEPGSKAGNRATAERWKRLLENSGHTVSILTRYQGQAADLMIALHTWRSHEAIRQFREMNPKIPLIGVLTGTDVYSPEFRDEQATHESMASADALIGLHRKVATDIPEGFRDKVRIVLQSAEKPTQSRCPATDPFDCCVIGHLRDEKDSLRAAMAARHLPDDSRIRIVQAGKPHNPGWRTMAEQEATLNPRFHWLGEIDRTAVQSLMRSSQVMVISSRMEGGANVVSEACRGGLPIIASDIPGNRGLLGDSYSGYYPVENEKALASLLLRAERDADFLAELRNKVTELAGNFTPAAEQAALIAAIDYAFSRMGSIASP